MATCPKCKASSRTDPNFVIEPAFVAQPMSTYSLAGCMPKVAVREVLQLRHTTCGWSIDGHIEDDYFVANAQDSE